MTVSRLKDIPGIGVDKMGQAADDVGNSDMLRLENLDTDLRPPEEALEATLAAIGRDDANSYLPFLGTNDVRRAATSRISATTGQPYDWNTQCVISAGGLSGILNALLAILEPGDEVIITDPAYAGLLNRIRLAGGVPKLVPLRVVDGGWRLDLEELRRAASARTRAVLTMSPSMPTGIVHTAEEWNAIAEVVMHTGAFLLHDAAMERILYAGKPVIHPASLDGMAERTITVGCVSKEYRMIGWRVGWTVGPAPIMADIGLVSLTNVVCQVGIAMPGAAAAITAKDDGIATATATWKARRDIILQALSDLPVVRPDGGWSLLIDTAGLGYSPVEASRLLFEKGRIAATPMTGWGSADIAGRYLRFVFANEPVERLGDIRERLRLAWQV
ncbi:putative N-succinyldiaminopimelate aminotransferase DapC [Labrenzia sp. THAF35]|uniref:pyridoxal phosphate-dependent aminotransferase n=1 Tax=Labrenzia sp. THAF35 TaxID=2587854 RepID=UPI001267AEA8|nr:pyridoxal phosphate-dependent aminotransferase [Labrenzia sp. THAF35]QFT66620.1 putative N-succinyldiaminopimelate aminotransferase DapC [Labrenzia sp. THAF35]